MSCYKTSNFDFYRHKDANSHIPNAPATAIASQNNYVVKHGVDNSCFCVFTESDEKHDEENTDDFKSSIVSHCRFTLILCFIYNSVCARLCKNMVQSM